MAKLAVTVACAPYDRVWPIIDGRVPIENCDVTFFPIDAEEAFARAFRSQDFDITELSASSHILTVARGEAHYVAIPAFVSRVFRHSSIYVRTDRIHAPADFRGKLVGVPEYQMTAALWIRGLLSDEYGVKSQDIKWRNGGLNHPGRTERIAINLPPEIELKPVAAGKTLSGLLEEGELDAVITARAPHCFTKGAPHVGRLFPDYRKAEEAYFRKTGLFPIMHLIAIRRSLVEAHPWLAQSALKAFIRAKQIAVQEMQDLGALALTLPWLTDDYERARAVMGADIWPYGVGPNRKALDAMLRWSAEQGLSQRAVTVEQLFAKGTVEGIQLKD